MPYTTEQYQGVLAETTTVNGYNRETIHAYIARPLGAGPFPGVVLIPHALGWTDFHKETAYKLAQIGYITVVPDIWCRVGHGTIEDVMAKSRSDGGLPDDQVIGDVAGAGEMIKSLAISNGKVGVIGSCSGGRHTFLVGCRTKDIFAAAVECWGGNVVQSPDKLTDAQPVSPIEYTKDLSCPLLGIFGNDDQNPTPDQVNLHEQELNRLGKDYEFHRYDGAGHGFYYYHLAMYRQEQAIDAWDKILRFFDQHLSA
jgi:carboxymethylenebutenolidase